MQQYCLMGPGAETTIDDIYERWVKKNVTVIEEPYDEVFGCTFVVVDPDGNLMRVTVPGNNRASKWGSPDLR